MKKYICSEKEMIEEEEMIPQELMPVEKRVIETLASQGVKQAMREAGFRSGGKILVKNVYSCISDKDLPFITGALKVDCRCYIKTPSSFSKSDTIIAELGYIRPISKPDWDNLGKTYSDMLTDVLILDDAHIVDGRCSKYYSLHPRIEMDIKYQLEPDSKYNERKINNINERK